jgi:predicted nucleic acid-binding protein
MENNSSKLKDKLVELNTEKQRLEQELKSLQSELIEKRSYSEDLKKKLEQAKAYLDYEKMKNSTLTYNYESMKETLKASNEKNELQRIRHRTEKEKLQKKLDLQGSEKKQKKETLKRKATLQEQNHMTEISKEETARWQAKCNQIEEELQKTHEHIEKLSRTEIYLKNQLLTKDLMISQIEALIKMHEEETLDPPDNVGLANVQSSNIAKLATMIEEIRYQYKKSDDKIKCVSCFKTPQECFLAMPCGHISCQNCKAEFEMICPNCSGKTKGLVRALVVEQIIAHLKRESENIEKAKKILRDQSLNSV